MKEKTYETIVLENGFILKIDYGDSTKEFDFRNSNHSRVYPRVRLYDSDENLISELIGENPDKRAISYNMPEGHDSKVLLY